MRHAFTYRWPTERKTEQIAGESQILCKVKNSNSMIDFYLETYNYKYAKEIHALYDMLNTTFM
jgi:hypothetical protein